tara:strand:- start:724 stop:1245 length:522 start_codon:yes stop_codon:yes gene_type:complete
MVSLGIDASTTTIGYAFIEDKKILDMGFIDIKKYKTLKEKVLTALDILEEKPYFNDKKKMVERICVEDSLSNFMFGRTSQQTIIKLAKFNALFCFIMEEATGIDVVSVNPNTARKLVFGYSREKGVKSKDFVKMRIDEMYNTKRWMKQTKRGNWDKRNFDAYDAVVVALCESN